MKLLGYFSLKIVACKSLTLLRTQTKKKVNAKRIMYLCGIRKGPTAYLVKVIQYMKTLLL